MAASHRPGPDAGASELSERLLHESGRFQFYQLVRLLLRLGAVDSTGPGGIYLRPALTLAAAHRDVAALARRDERQPSSYLLTVNFFGLYGPASPLPTFYTEDLIAQARDGYAGCREFIDLVNHQLGALLYPVWNRPRLSARMVEQREPRIAALLWSLYGWLQPVGKPLPGLGDGWRYAPLFGQRQRSLTGLRWLLADWTRDPSLVVDAGQRATRALPADQRWRLGEQRSALGDDGCLGAAGDDYQSRIRIRCAVAAGVRSPCGEDGRPHPALLTLIRHYLPAPADLEFICKRPMQAALGTGRLGASQWLGPADGAAEPARVVVTAGALH